MSLKTLYATLIVAALAVSACGKKEAPAPAPAPPPPASTAPAPAPVAGVSVGTITMGKAIGADKKVTASTDTFAKTDTIYASIDTTGSGSATLKAKWTYSKDGQTATVKEDSLTVMTSGPATHEFNISKPDGWPAGDYKVEVMANDAPAGSKTFKVQ